jgi:multiple sugar transport system ATP-binding protein
MELYHWPSNLFVAQFIGSPPMNLLPVQIPAAGQLLLGSRRFALEEPLAAATATLVGQALTAGLRPEHLRLAPATNRNLAAEVCHSEALGNEQLLTCRLAEGDHLVQLRADPDRQLSPGETVHLDVENSGWRLFDGDGNALTLPSPPAPASAKGLPQLPELG